MGKLPEYHVLNFSHDGDTCSLTAAVNGERFHVTVDPTDFRDRSKAGKRLAKQYRTRLAQSKDAEVDHEAVEGTAPLFVQEDEEDPQSDSAKDSGVDVDGEEHDNESDEPTTALARWMLAPLNNEFSNKAKQARSVQDWYRCPTHYFRLCIEDEKVKALREESPSAATQKQTDELIPSMPLPKYLRNLEIPMVNASDMTVVDESADPAPFHPSIVELDGTTYFLKGIDNTQHQPTKRELQIMKRIESKGLHKDMRVPLVRGLVHFEDDTRNIMGFIMDSIASPTPLTKMLDGDVDESKRLKWASEAARVVDVLHQNGIIWGDAKGDNFVVDANDDLWIIDWGGSYTEGWVDPELKETEEGDNMGVRKICNGLQDPDSNTITPEEEAEALESGAQEEEIEETRAMRRELNGCSGWEEEWEQQQQQSAKEVEATTKKRKAEDCADWEESYRRENESRKKSKTERGEGEYCYCGGPDSGQMLACDGDDCRMEWFHFDCVGIEEAPAEKKWFCDECQSA